MKFGIDIEHVMSLDKAIEVMRDRQEYDKFVIEACEFDIEDETNEYIALEIAIKNLEEKKTAEKTLVYELAEFDDYYRCSSCQCEQIEGKDKYCFRCGAKFEEGVE